MSRIAKFIWIGLLAATVYGQDVKIAYTGKLLGYARMPDVQRVRQAGWFIGGGFVPISKDGGMAECKKRAGDCQRLYQDQPGGMASSGARFLVPLLNDPTLDLVLGTGDNFAMDFNGRFVVASVYTADGSMQEEYIAKDVLQYLGSGFTPAAGYWLDLRDPQSETTRGLFEKNESGDKSTIATDNVAAFLTAAHYDAVVPGKHDFYYGPERLRQLADLLSRQTKPTQLLGANLIIQSTPVSPPVTLDKTSLAKQRNFAVRVEGRDMQWEIPSTVLPWARSFRIKKYLESGKAALVDPNRGATMYVATARDRVDHGAAGFTLDGVASGGDIAYTIHGTDVLPAGATLQLCAPLVAPANQKQPDFCVVVDVATPFFQYSRSRAWVSTPKAVVMGVVEPGLESFIGSLNTMYRGAVQHNIGKDVSTKVVTIDPKVALLQLTDYCVQVGDCKDKEQRRILLAQMPRDEATVLNDRFGATTGNRKFDLVIAEADDRFPTGKVNVTCVRTQCAVVLVPDEIIQVDGSSPHTQVQFAELRADSSLATDISRPSDSVSERPSSASCLTPLLKTFLAAHGFDTVPEDALTPTVLIAMRERLHADVAVLQDRDFFDAEHWLQTCATEPIGTSTIPYQRERATLEQILWKGDFLVSRMITGAALKSALAGSEKLVDQEKMYQVQAESGRSLRTFGLYQDPDSKTWYANGAAVDDKAMYSVAMSDHLASGDTGYADFKTDAGSGTAPKIDQLFRITRVVMAGITAGSSYRGIDPDQYLDDIQQRPPLESPKASWVSQLYTTLRKSATERHPDLKEANDRIGQTRPYWRIFVDKGSFAFSDYHNNVRALDELTAKFGTDTDSGVTAPRSRTMPIGLQFEVRREMGTWHFFSRTELDYALEKIQQEGDVERYVTTFGNDTISQENGIRFTFHGSMRSRPWTGAFFSFYGVTNPETPHNGGYKAGVQGCTPSKDTATCPTGLGFDSDVARTSRIMGKFGLRRESEENWIEAGITAGQAIRPSAFSVAQNGVPLATPAPCAFSSLDSSGASVKLSDCLENFKVVVPDETQADKIAQSLRLISYTATKPESGLFVNFNYTLPLPENFFFKDLFFEQRGTLFFKSGKDLVSDTRINEQLTFGPTIALSSKWPGLTLKPSYKLFFFESKVSNYRLTARTIDISLDYRFDWKTGLKWKNVLRYGRP